MTLLNKLGFEILIAEILPGEVTPYSNNELKIPFWQKLPSAVPPRNAI